MSVKYANIIVDNRSSQVDRPFTYQIDSDMAHIVKEGMRVVIPFGRGNKLIKGLVISIEDNKDLDYKIKSIVDVLDDKPLISNNLIQLSLWIKDRYLASYIDSFQPCLPSGDFKEVNTVVELREDYIQFQTIAEEDKIINYLKMNDNVLLDRLKVDLNIKNINMHLNNLESSGVIVTCLTIKTTNNKKKRNG